jgi:hypothetical protein
VLTLLGAAGSLAAASPAHASTPLVTATTTFSNYPAIGGAAGSGLPGAAAFPSAGSPYIWAEDDFTRTLTITTDNNASDCNVIGGFGTSDQCYSAGISDTGTAVTVPGAFQPDQGNAATAAQDANKLLSPTETVSFTGTATYHFYVPIGDGVLPSASDVPTTENLGDSPSAEEADTASWFQQAFATHSDATGVLDDDWSWTYTSGCETWTDAFVNNAGQSTPLATDGNITGAACTTTPAPVPTPTPAASNFGDEVNSFGNGFDVLSQHYGVNAVIAGWPATQGDPATHFVRAAEGSGWRFEAVLPGGSYSGLCVSDPAGGYPGDPGGPDGLVLRGCNAGLYQQFKVAGGDLVSAATGGFVDPDGKGGQLSTGTSPVSWGGSHYAWVPFASLP